MSRSHTFLDSSVGELTLVAEDGILSGVYFPGHWTRPDRSTFGERSHRGLEQAAEQLTQYFAGERRAFTLPRAITGDGFRRKVWEILNRIPYGTTTTYGEIALELGDPVLARAVGQAVGHNPLSVIVPCHRVVGKAGTLTGYAGGLARKRALLELEGAFPRVEHGALALF
jgi:methylated-DNA-[protein]-cysteine S-methyltransferase